MNTLAQAIAQESNLTTTEKGMSALKSSLNANVDLFFKIGAMRGQNVLSAFQAAFDENAEMAVRIALWARDIRGGAGERQLFRDILKYLEIKSPSTVYFLLSGYKIPELGRWDDLLVFNTTDAKEMAYSLILHGLTKADRLCAKWMPRKGLISVELAKYAKFAPKQWRKLLVNLTNVVETKMCAKEWDSIDFGKLPSLAAKRYSKAFQRNAHDAYTAYIGRLGEGLDRVNAGAIYPHQIVENLQTVQDVVLADAQWAALPNYLGKQSIIPMIDTSGSMHSANVAHIAFALGMYIAEKGSGPFKDCFLTFSDNSKLQKLTGSITSRLQQVERAHWDGTTNIAGAFDEILRIAVTNSVLAKDMPDIILILSDMQFDQCVTTTSTKLFGPFDYAPKFNPNAMEMIADKYNRHGYSVPKIVFWNIADRGNNIPVKFNTTSTALVSGFSPAIMKSVLKAKDFTPQGIMLETIMQDRYTI